MVRSSMVIALLYSAPGAAALETEDSCKAEGTCAAADEVTMLHINRLDVTDDEVELSEALDVCLAINDQRTQEQLTTMSLDDKRNTVIVYLHSSGFGSVAALQGKANKELAQLCPHQPLDACLVKNKQRTGEQVATMSQDGLRNTVITFLHDTGLDSVATLQDKTDKELGQLCPHQALAVQATCGNHVCQPHLAHKARLADEADIVCAAQSLCTDAECCEAICSGFTCMAPLTPRPDAANTICASGTCHPTECCEATCEAFTCEHPSTRKPDLVTDASGVAEFAKGGADRVCDGATCTKTECCDPPQCCDQVAATCLACKVGTPVKEYCETHPMTRGCEEFRKPVYAFVGEGYCRPGGCNMYDSDCRVNGFRHSMGSEDKSHDECKMECDNHRQCVGYSFEDGQWCYVYVSGGETPEGWTSYAQNYFTVATSSGPGHHAECFRRVPGTGCCSENTAHCLACAKGVTIEAYCHETDPNAAGCEEVSITTTTTTQDPCGGAGVHHTTCQSQAQKDLGCFYVKQELTEDCDEDAKGGPESCSNACKTEHWGCYQSAGLPRESCVHAADKVDNFSRRYHVTENYAIAGDCLEKCMWFAGMGDADSTETCEQMCNNMWDCNGFAWRAEQGGKCMFMKNAKLAHHLGAADAAESEQRELDAASMPKCFIQETREEWFKRQREAGTVPKVSDCDE